MNADDFEPRLQRQPLRAPPANWRGEILAVAHAARQAASAGRAGAPSPAADAIPTGSRSPTPGGALGTARPSWLRWFTGSEHGRQAAVFSLASLLRRLRGWLWPHPVAWGALAACWVLVVALNSAAGAPSIARVRLTAGSTSMLALQASDWGDLPGLPAAAQPAPPAPKPSPKVPSPTSSLIRRHETQVA